MNKQSEKAAREFLREDDFRARVGCSRSTAWRLCRDGVLHPQMIGVTKVFSERDIKAYHDFKARPPAPRIKAHVDTAKALDRVAKAIEVLAGIQALSNHSYLKKTDVGSNLHGTVTRELERIANDGAKQTSNDQEEVRAS
jgi:predicted DNA-binding transcriptional regulator AlpA